LFPALGPVELEDVQARQAVTSSDANIEAEQTALDVVRREVPITTDIAEASVAHARAMVAEAEASESQARHDAQRFRELVAEGVVDKRSSEEADLALTVDRDGSARSTGYWRTTRSG